MHWVHVSHERCMCRMRGAWCMSVLSCTCCTHPLLQTLDSYSPHVCVCEEIQMNEIMKEVPPPPPPPPPFCIRKELKSTEAKATHTGRLFIAC
jgi:hypothetical protein